MANPIIKHRYTGAVLFEGEAGMTTRQMLEKATASKVNLRCSDLRYSDLRYSDLRYSDLSYSDLRYSDLRYSDLSDSNLSSSNLSSSDLSGSNLRGSDLSDSNLSSSNLSSSDLSSSDLSYGKAIGKRPYFSIGPIGSRCDYAQLWITDKGSFVNAGCFTGTLDEFAEACIKTHGETDHGKECAMAVQMFEAHAALWTPKETK